MIAAAGRAIGRRFARTYDKVATTAVDADQLAWFTGLQALRILIEVATWHAQTALDDHPGHPFLSLDKPLTDQIEATTGLAVTGP